MEGFKLYRKFETRVAVSISEKHTSLLCQYTDTLTQICGKIYQGSAGLYLIYVFNHLGLVIFGLNRLVRY